jgi:RNA polymerase sigma-70 factor (ECF subfamily)
MTNFSNDERTLIAAAQQGTMDAFNVLVVMYQDMAFSVAYRILQEEDSAADVTQNAFISAYRKIDQFRGENFKSWLMRIVTNACYDELRLRKRHPTASLDDIEGEGDGLYFDAEDEAPLMASIEGPEKAVQRGELQAVIENCLQQLNEGYRIIVVLADVEGYSYEEAASLSGISLGTVKSRLSRARASLRDCLRKKAELLPDQYRQDNN